MAAINPVITVPVVNPLRSPEAVTPTPVEEVLDIVVGDAPNDAPNYVSIYATSILAVTLVFLIGVGAPAAMAFGGAAGWGLGAMCGFWGGPSFGVMVGSARVSSWFDKHGEH